MYVNPKKTIRSLTICLMATGIFSTLVRDVYAKRRHYEYQIHHIYKLYHHRSVNRYGRWIKAHRRGGSRKIWRRYKTGYYHKGHWIRYRRHLTRGVKRRNVDPEYHYSSSNVNDMDNVSQMEYQTIKMINVDRASHNLPPLRETVALKKLARARAHQSVQLDYLTHKDSRGRNYYEQDAKRMQIHLGAYSGENIASAGLGLILMDDNPQIYTNNNGKDMANMDEDEMIYHDGHSNWGHRYNTLNSHYKSVGIGAEQRPNTNNYYLAENFSS